MPAARICSRCQELSENSEVSELEKKADKPIKTAKTMSSKTRVISTGNIFLGHSGSGGYSDISADAAANSGSTRSFTMDRASASTTVKR